MDKIEVTQADIDAAQAFFRDDRTGLAAKFQLGAEPQPLLEAFARHRLTIQAAFAEREARLVRVLEGLIDDEPCWYDHHGYCQTHYVTSPCEMAKARATLAALKDRTHD